MNNILRQNNLDGLFLYFDEMFRTQRFWERISSLGHMVYISAGGVIINDKDICRLCGLKKARRIFRKGLQNLLLSQNRERRAEWITFCVGENA